MFEAEFRLSLVILSWKQLITGIYLNHTRRLGGFAKKGREIYNPSLSVMRTHKFIAICWSTLDQSQDRDLCFCSSSLMFSKSSDFSVWRKVGEMLLGADRSYLGCVCRGCSWRRILRRCLSGSFVHSCLFLDRKLAKTCYTASPWQRFPHNFKTRRETQRNVGCVRFRARSDPFPVGINANRTTPSHSGIENEQGCFLRAFAEGAFQPIVYFMSRI